MNWLVRQLEETVAELSNIFNTPLFEFSGTQYSISLVFVLLLVTVTVFVVSRILSEWIKRRLLVKVKLDRGTREVIATLIRYVLTLLGLIIVLQTAGVDLSSLTVLAGVLGIGLGFGLQNLASNFISGLTILFEQPIRVGDFIEVNELLGTVENISIRSTTVRTLDGVFVIVPNIKFVENNVVNWSYRDPRSRLHISIGVEYGTDPLLVTEALLTAARREPKVLSEPAPKVWFRGFADSDMQFELLVWINQPTESDPIKSSINFLIEREFRRRNIQIPYPQRDLYIRNIEDFKTLFREDTTNSIDNGSKPLPESASEFNYSADFISHSNLALRDLLRRISYFEQCGDTELWQLIEYGYRQLYPKGQVVCREGSPGESFYIILKGSVEIFSKKVEQYIATLNEGEFFGEMSLLMGIPRSATVRTLEDTLLFVVEKNDLQKLLNDHQQLADQIAQKLVERQQTLKEMGILVDSSEEAPFERIRKRLQTLFGI
jgi:potassium-dependent mechanosensitive channel